MQWNVGFISPWLGGGCLHHFFNMLYSVGLRSGVVGPLPKKGYSILVHALMPLFPTIIVHFLGKINRSFEDSGWSFWGALQELFSILLFLLDKPYRIQRVQFTWFS